VFLDSFVDVVFQRLFIDPTLDIFSALKYSGLLGRWTEHVYNQVVHVGAAV
jgi:hypothetical protein